MQAENARLRRRLEKALADLERAQVCTAYARWPLLLTGALRQLEQEEQHAACALLMEEHESLEGSYNEALEQVCQRAVSRTVACSFLCLTTDASRLTTGVQPPRRWRVANARYAAPDQPSRLDVFHRALLLTHAPRRHRMLGRTTK